MPVILPPQQPPVSPAPTPAEVAPIIPPPAAGVTLEGGTIVWSGRLERGEILTLTGSQVSQGTLEGALPGVPVMVDVDAREFAIAEAPGPSNGWKKIAIRSKNRRHTVVTIQWHLLH